MVLAPRQTITYDCPNGHLLTVPMSAEADVPAEWECHCGAKALQRDGVRPTAKPTKPARTHWDMLRERRSIEELEELLAERLEILRDAPPASATPESQPDASASPSVGRLTISRR